MTESVLLLLLVLLSFAVAHIFFSLFLLVMFCLKFYLIVDRHECVLRRQCDEHLTKDKHLMMLKKGPITRVAWDRKIG